ncbi:hypothetical protein KLER11_gp54 [Pararheinheimera phage vB_PsoM_KLER1-1]|nr:hypothetical protein KLER11_gp54 [Pararheinheimera phage vB_PsoM_KLER1-1]
MKFIKSLLAYLVIVLPLAAAMKWPESNLHYIGITFAWIVMLIGLFVILLLTVGAYAMAEGKGSESLNKSVTEHYTSMKSMTFISKSLKWFFASLIVFLLSLSGAVFTSVLYALTTFFFAFCNKLIAEKLDSMASTPKPETQND